MLQAKHYTMRVESISIRQSQIIAGFLESKERILDQTGQITVGILENIANRYVPVQALAGNRDEQPMLEERNCKMLKGSDE